MNPKEIATITLTETAAPSRSKGRGWAVVNNTFATPKGRTLDLGNGTEIEITTGAELRRASGQADKTTKTVKAIVTGNPADTITLSVGSPQSYDTTISGVILADIRVWVAEDFDTPTDLTSTTVSYHGAYNVRNALKDAGCAYVAHDSSWVLRIMEASDMAKAAELANMVERAGGTAEENF